MSWIKKKLFLVRKPFGFCVGQTDSKYAQNSDSRALATAKRCIWHFGVMEDYKVGPLLFLRESQGQKPVTTKKAYSPAPPETQESGFSHILAQLRSAIAHNFLGKPAQQGLVFLFSHLGVFFKDDSGYCKMTKVDLVLLV